MNSITKLCSIYGIGNHTPITKNAVSRWRTLENLPKVFKDLRRRGIQVNTAESVNKIKKEMGYVFNSFVPHSVTPQLKQKVIELKASTNPKSDQLLAYANKKYFNYAGHETKPKTIKDFGTTTFDPDSLENKDTLHLYRGVTGHAKATNAEELAFGGGYVPNAVHGGPELSTASGYGEVFRTHKDQIPGLVAVYEANPKGQNFTADWGIENLLAKKKQDTYSHVPPYKANFIRDKRDLDDTITRKGSWGFYETLLSPEHNKLIGFGLQNSSGKGLRMIPASDEKGVSSLIRKVVNIDKNKSMTVADTFPSIKAEFGTGIPQPKENYVYQTKLESDIMSNKPNWRFTKYPGLLRQIAERRVKRFVNPAETRPPVLTRQPAPITPTAPNSWLSNFINSVKGKFNQ